MEIKEQKIKMILEEIDLSIEYAAQHRIQREWKNERWEIDAATLQAYVLQILEIKDFKKEEKTRSVGEAILKKLERKTEEIRKRKNSK